MSHSHGSMSSSMASAFYVSPSTPLFSTLWTPGTTATYAATCIFLIFFAAFFRFLAAGKHWLEHRWLDQDVHRRYIAVKGTPTEAERISVDSEMKNATLVSERGSEERVMVVRRAVRPVTPWRLSVDLPRALYATLMAGVGYLLMLAVMTMNLGYFLAVLGGTFLGELVVGRYTQLEEHGHGR